MVELEPGHRSHGGNAATLPCERLSGEAETLGQHLVGAMGTMEGGAGREGRGQGHMLSRSLWHLCRNGLGETVRELCTLQAKDRETPPRRRGDGAKLALGHPQRGCPHVSGLA